MEKHINRLLEPFEYTIQTGGKNTRGILVEYIKDVFTERKFNEEHVSMPENLKKEIEETVHNKEEIYMKKIIEDVNIVHNCSLMIDDIQDESEKRRGQPCSHIIYGIDQTINSAYMKCFELLQNIKNKYPEKSFHKIQEVVIKIIHAAHVGQGLDLLWTKEQYIPTIEEYNYMVQRKTGASFIGAKEMCIANLNEFDVHVNQDIIDALSELLQECALFYQIRDDYINLTSPSYWITKTFCEDFDEKKVSYVFVILKTYFPENSLYQQLYKKTKLTNKDKLYFYKEIYSKKIFEKIYLELDKKLKNIIMLDSKLTNSNCISPNLKKILDKLTFEPAIEPNKIPILLSMKNVLT